MIPTNIQFGRVEEFHIMHFNIETYYVLVFGSFLYFIKFMMSNWQFSSSVVWNRMQVCILIKVNNTGRMTLTRWIGSRITIIREIEVITK